MNLQRMTTWSLIAAVGGSVLLMPLIAAAADDDKVGTAQRQLLDKYCIVCHNYTDYAGGVEFETYDPTAPQDDAKITERMLKKLRVGMMPPAGKARPDPAQVRDLVRSLETKIDAHEKASLSVPKLHRLNRAEYANAVRDLLALDIDTSKFLPADDSSRGFDNQAGALTLSSALLDAYLSAAARVSRVAIGDATSPAQVTYRIPQDTTQNYHVEGLPLGTRGGIQIDHTFPSDGNYTVKVIAVTLGNMGSDRPFGEIRGEQLLVYVDDKRVAKIDWDKALGVGRRFAATADDEGGAAGQLKPIDVKLPVTGGPHKIGVTFLATNFAPGLDMNHAFDRSTIETGGLPGFTFYPHVGSVRIDGPTEAKGAADSPSRERIFVCHPSNPSDEEPCARQITTMLAHRAYRGYATPQNVDKLMSFYTTGRRNGSFDDGIESMVQRVLVDPKFLFRVEHAPNGVAPGAPYHISDLELASRLSFFLWSSVPDDTLLQLAESKQLTKRDVLQKQVQRMLGDPRAAALTRNFASEWLGLRSLQGHDPVVDQFPDFDDNLREAFREEAQLFFTSLLQEDRSVLDLLTADYTFVNERLAKHYGIPGIRGSEFRRVKLEGDLAVRDGILGKGAMLTVSSQPGRTSPVIRGQWVLRTLLGTPAPDPPPNVPALKAETTDQAGNGKVPTMRETLSAHRGNPACAGCHKMMDPIGFALEPFDAVGHLRTVDQSGQPINAKDVMYDGTPVDGAAGVRTFVLKYKDQYVQNVAANLLTYALGRGVEYDDMPTVRNIVHTSARDGYKLKTIIEAITASDVFQMNVAPGGPDVDKGDKSDGIAGPAKSGTASTTTAVHRPPGG
jgi:mono/diheme cytochrome c family protein